MNIKRTVPKAKPFVCQCRQSKPPILLRIPRALYVAGTLTYAGD